MSLDNTIWLAGIVTEATVVGLLIYRRVWRLLPLFCLYCAWDLLSNASSYAIALFFHSANPNSHAYLTTYIVATIIDSVLLFGVLVELAWSVLRPIRDSLPRYVLLAIGTMILIIGSVIWMLVAMPGPGNLPVAWHRLLRLQETVSLLRILFFVALSAFGQWLSISWRDRELQVATGLGIYSVVSLAVTMLQTHQGTLQQYVLLNRIAIFGFLCSLLYWAFSFAQKEAERRAFTPQMQNMLLAVAGVARADRAALAESILESRGSRKR